MTTDTIYSKVCEICFDNVLFYRVNYRKLSSKFINKLLKYDIGKLEIDSIKITDIGIDCNLFTMKINQITTIENINISHNRILTN